MTTLRLRIILLFVCAVSCPAIAQENSPLPDASIDRYTLKVTVDIERHLLRSEAELQLRLLKDSVRSVALILGPSCSMASVRDTLEKSVEYAVQTFQPDTAWKEVSFPIADTLKRGDTVLLRISYETVCDTASTLPLFVNGRELVLAPHDAMTWWPVLSPRTNPSPNQLAPAILEATLPTHYLVLSNGRTDSLRENGQHTTWRVTYPRPMSLASCFILVASNALTKKTLSAADSSVEFSLYYTPGRFNNEFARALLLQLRDANAHFAAATGRGARTDIRVVVLGTDDGLSRWFTSGGLIVGRNSYAYAAFDSTLLSSGLKNPWLREFAHQFDISSTDSTPWFTKGWARYLTTDYLLNKYANDAEYQRGVRLSLLSTTLDFYPSRTLAHDRMSVQNELEFVSGKGAYVFLMLEHLLGEEVFRGVTKRLYQSYGDSGVTLPEFQRLCEAEYGSSMDWFFRQWVYRSGFPEITLATDVKQTVRGTYSLRARIGQRGDLFATPVDLVFSSNNRSMTKRVVVDKQEQEFSFILPFLPTKNELDPNYYLLRWVPRLRLLAHARSAVSFRVLDHNLDNSEREAALTLQLDPNNLTGWNNLALFSLGKAAVLKGDLKKAEEYFRRAWALEASEPTQLYSVLSLVRLGNVLEMEGRREEAVELYKLSITLADRSPALFSLPRFEAEKYLRERFISSEKFWFDEF